MATRFAGDVFTSAISPKSSSENSVLSKYFDDLSSIESLFYKGKKKGSGETENSGSVPVFGGFKPMKKTEVTPLNVAFGGFKPMGY